MFVRRAIAVGLLAMIAGGAAPAFAQKAITLRAPPSGALPKIDPEVQKHFDTANDLYKEGKYDDAMVEYDAAYDASKNWKILYNRGQCLVMVRREPDAIASLQKYLDEGGDKIDPARRKQVEQDIAKLKERLGTIVITGAPDGSVVEIDGHAVATLPVTAPITAGAGKHEVTVRPPGNGIPAIQQIQVVAGKESAVPVSFVPTTGGTTTVGGTLPPPMPQGMQPTGADVSPPPPPPHKEPGGIIAPSFLLSLGLGGGVTTGNANTDTVTSGTSSARNARGVGLVDVGATWHPTPFWEFGVFVGGGTGSYSVKSGAVSDPSSNVSYGYNIIGLRLRIHPIRARHFDGWLGLDIGRYGETWSTSGTNAVLQYTNGSGDKITGSALGLGLAFGVDFPISRNWSLGGAFRYLSATQVQCSANNAPTGTSGKDICPASGADRGVSEFLLRLVFAIPYGPAPAEPQAASSSLKPGLGF